MIQPGQRGDDRLWRAPCATFDQGPISAISRLFVRAPMHGYRDIQVIGKVDASRPARRQGRRAAPGSACSIALFQALHLDEIGMGGAGISNRHQRAVESDDGNVAGARTRTPIAGRTPSRDDRAHRDEGGEDLGADGVSRQQIPPCRHFWNPLTQLWQDGVYGGLRLAVLGRMRNRPAFALFYVHHKLHFGVDVAVDLEGSRLP